MPFFKMLSKFEAEFQTHNQKSPKALFIREIPVVSRSFMALGEEQAL